MSQVLVAMSGGVDSTAAAIMLKEQGFDVVGVSMQVWDYRGRGGSSTKATCCAPADFDDARRAANKYDFPFYVFDFEKEFEKEVINPFVDSYLIGETPNPCMLCNSKIKFNSLMKRADDIGIEKVATGHYARIKETSDGKLGLFTASYKEKDQTYFLFNMNQEQLRKTIFPVGEMKKETVRKYLEQRDIAVASKPESQDICFVSGKVGDFVKSRQPNNSKPGVVVGEHGEKLGEHGGIENFTIGQRRGHGIGGRERLYVLDIDAVSNQITLGEKDKLRKDSFVVNNVNWISGEAPQESENFLVKLRYRHVGEECKATVLDENSVRLTFTKDWSAVTPGQAAVLYNTELEEDGSTQVIGGGIIQK